MATTIVLVPDLYYRNWDEKQLTGPTATGELWLVLRPHILCGQRTEAAPLGDRLDQFLAWAKAPNDSGGPGAWNFRYQRPDRLMLNNVRCADDTVLQPVNLPGDVDVEIVIGRGTVFETLRLERSIRCRMRPLDKDGKPAGPHEAFAPAFNARFSERMQKAGAVSDTQFLSTVHSFTQLLDAGRRIAVSASESDAHHLKDPYPGPMPQFVDRDSNSFTSLFWCLGLMVRLGTQRELDLLRGIDSIEIALSSKGREIDRLFFPDLGRGMDVTGAYFARIGEGFQRRLDTVLKPHADILYVNPEFHSLVPPRSGAIWTLEAPKPNADEPASSAPPPMLGRLAQLAGIEARAAIRPTDEALEKGAAASEAAKVPLENEPIGASIAFTPGVSVTGTFEPYRKYPAPIADANSKRLPTLMLFKPDKASAPLLAALFQALPLSRVQAAFSQVTFEGWTIEFVHSGVLPWDGPEATYRVLASSAGPAAKGEPRTRTAFAHPVFFAATLESLRANKVGVPETASRHLWPAPPEYADPAALAAYWATKAPAWPSGLPFNALQVDGLNPDVKAGVHLVFADQFNFLPAESAVRLEQVLTLTALPANTGSAVRTGTDRLPVDDYQDNLINFNTVFLLDSKGKEIDKEILRTPLATTYAESVGDVASCRVGLSNREQSVPLLHGWPRDPLDRRDDPGSDAGTIATSPLWQAIRTSVLTHYGYGDHDDSLSLEIEHTYGDRIQAGADGTPLAVLRSPRLDWPVELATDAERGKAGPANAAAGPDGAFMACTYLHDGPGGGDALVLTIDQSFLVGPAVSATNVHRLGDEDRSRYALAVSAWRALAELADRRMIGDDAGAEPSVVTITMELASFDVGKGLDAHALSLGLPGDGSADLAAILGAAPFSDAWAKSVTMTERVDIPGNALAELRGWAARLLLGTETPGSGKRDFTLAIGASKKIGDLANLVRAVLEVKRPPRLAPAPSSQHRLLPISQQPGLFRVQKNTLQRAWSDRGYGPADGELAKARLDMVWTMLESAHQSWIDERTRRKDSINLDLRSTPADSTRQVTTALVSALPGSDWFAPEGPGAMNQEAKSLQPVLLPFGFAPCGAHPLFGPATQEAMERVAWALQDMLDAAFFSWTSRTAAEWRSHFDKLSAMADGRLATWAQLLVEALWWPEPHTGPDQNDGTVTALALAYRGGTGHLAAMPRIMRRMLVGSPALFADSRAFLLTALHFVKGGTGAAASPTALARVRFLRALPDKKVGKDSNDTVSSVLTLADLVLGDPSGGRNFERALALFEPLDTTRYGAAFQIAATQKGHDFAAESFEDVVDPGQENRSWTPLPAILPLKAANRGGERTVHLASRRPIAAPTLVWSGESATLAGALLATGSDTRNWSVAELSGGGKQGSGDLRMAAKHVGPSLSMPATADEGIGFALYGVQGDDNVGNDPIGAIANDAYFVRLSPIENNQAMVRTMDDATALGDTTKLALRQLLASPRGSQDAANAIVSLFLGSADQDGDFRRDIAQLCKIGRTDLPSVDEFVLVKSNEKDAHDLLIADKRGKPEDVLAAYLFTPSSAGAADAAGPGPKTLYLLLALRTTVWRPSMLDFRQGRNLPYDKWFDDKQADRRPRFAPEFWMANSPTAAPTRLGLNRYARNLAGHWTSRTGHVVKLKADWRRERLLTDLLATLLRSAGVRIGDGESSFGGQAPILSNGAVAMWLSQELSVVIYHEQFEDDPDGGALPIGRFPLHALPGQLGSKPTPASKAVWFPAGYQHFSVDFQWFTASGVSLLRLERMFVRVDPA